MDRLPNFLSYGATLTRASRARGSPRLNFFVNFWTASSCNYCSFSLILAKCEVGFTLKGFVALKLGRVFSNVVNNSVRVALYMVLKVVLDLRYFVSTSARIFLCFQTQYLEMIWVVSRRGLCIPRLGVINGPLKFLTARKILPLLDLLAKFKRVLACSCSLNFCSCSHARFLVSIARNFVNPSLG